MSGVQISGSRCRGSRCRVPDVPHSLRTAKYFLKHAGLPVGRENELVILMISFQPPKNYMLKGSFISVIHHFTYQDN